MSCAPSSNPAARTSKSSRINDLGPVETNAHLLRYDFVHGRFPGDGQGRRRHHRCRGTGPIKVTADRAIRPKLPWKALGVDIALECTGIFTVEGEGRGASRRRRQAGADLGARPTNADLTVVYGVNHDKLTTRPHRRLQRLLHHQLPRAGRQGDATTPIGIEQGLHDDDPLLHRRPADAGHDAQGSATAPAPRRCR